MSKRPRQPGKPNQPGQPGRKRGAAPSGPRLRLIAIIAAKMAEEAARAGSDHPEPDAELLRQCAIVNQVNAHPVTVSADEWQRAVLRSSSLQALTLEGLRAKLKIALMIVGVKPEPGEEDKNLDRIVLWLALSEVLALLEDAQA